MLAQPRDIDESLREEFFRERAATLANAGERLQTAIEKMQELDDEIRHLMTKLQAVSPGSPHSSAMGCTPNRGVGDSQNGAANGTSYEAPPSNLATNESRQRTSWQVIGQVGGRNNRQNNRQNNGRNIQQLIGHANEVIERYNAAREYAQLRYYYFIVTREALGLRRHHTVEEFFRIGPKRDYIR
jgi:hypothetical protein